MTTKRIYTHEEATKESIDYFKGDELAASVFVGKYALRNEKHELLECSPDQAHRRIAKEFARIEKKYPNPLSEDQIYEYFKNFKYIVPQGSPMSAIGNPYQVQSASNCFVIPSPLDSYGGILHTDQEQAQVMKRRGGVGFDISNIRPKGLSTKNAARTTDGIGVFMARFSNTCREVAQNGRRGALMLSISCHHPEIKTFINIKRDKKKVTGANISIRMTDEFMTAVKNDKQVELRFPVDSKTPTISEMVNAREIWNEIIQAAWESAEPGILFWDNVINNGPADIYEGYKSTSTNPCIVGDTLIAVADGRNAVSIKKLAEENKDVPVYSTNVISGQTEIKWGRNPRKTGDKKEVWKLTLDDNSILIATPNHKILKKNLEYTNLKDLKVGESITPFYSFNSNGYRQISSVGSKMVGGAFRNRRQYRVIHEFHNGKCNSKEFAIHHADMDSYNDSISNLLIMSHEDHYKIHADKMMGSNNPYHKMSEEWKTQFASHPGESNGRYLEVTNEELLKHGKAAFEKNGKLTSRVWQEYASNHNLPQYLGNEFRFGSFKNFSNQVCSNHKVKSVEFFGYEDVYNITIDDNHNYHIITSSSDNRFITSSGICVKNCGEITLSPYDSCRLMVVNLNSFVNNPFTPEAEFDFVKFAEVTQVAQRLMDDMIDIELEQIDKILKKIHDDAEPAHVKKIEVDLWNNIKKACINGRRTGLGITALGDTLASLNIRYGSKESIMKTEEIYKALAVNSEKSSCMMARDRGAFPIFDAKLEKGHPFIERLMEADSELKSLYKKHGRRNISTTTTAPVGSVSTMTQTTSGIEPSFLLRYTRRKKINPTDKSAAKVDFVDDMGDKWQEFPVYHHGFRQWMEVTGKEKIEDSPYFKATSNEIDWVASVDLQAAAQKWVSHSISKTCNLPNSATKELVSEIYMKAWESGCKGFTIYRDGCRTGVLVEEKPKEVVAKSGRDAITITKTTAPKRPASLKCEVHHVKLNKKLDKVRTIEYCAVVGLFEGGEPYELFVFENGTIDKKYDVGKLVKKAKGHYDVEFEDGFVIKNIMKDQTEEEELVTRLVSISLRHGTPLEHLVHQLEKVRTDNIASFTKVMYRVLKKYIKNGVKVSGETCPSCGGKDIIRMEGCQTCKACGYSKC